LIVQEINWRCPEEVFEQFSELEGLVFLDSAQADSPYGRYSFIAFEPFEIIQTPPARNPFEYLNERLAAFPLETVPELPPFQGGAAGFFSYELNRFLENSPCSLTDDGHFPDMAVGLYDLVIGFDVVLQRVWVFSSGYPEKKAAARKRRAVQRLEATLVRWQQPFISRPCSEAVCPKEVIESHFTREKYEAMVREVQNFIRSGDIFQANVSRRFHAKLPLGLGSVDLYRRLRKRNPAPFSAYVNLMGTCLVSASPERFLKVSQGEIEARPIKGTAPRGTNTAEDNRQAEKLQTSAKDRAENIMIVDLLRNDLSKVCRPHSVCVPQLCVLESHPTVHHLVSSVQGRLREEVSALDALRAAFPGGSVTGAPKIRAMEIIAALEPVVRGPYCGSIGWLGFDGNMDTSITIRTFVLRERLIFFQAGGAIVLDSDPESEFDETTDKARALWEVLTGQACS